MLAGLNYFWAKLGIKQRNKHCPLPFRDAFYLSVNEPRKLNVRPQRKRLAKGNIGWPDPRAFTSLLLSVKQKCDGKFNLVHSVTSLVILPNILTGAERGLIDFFFFFIKLAKIFRCTSVLHLGDLKRRLVSLNGRCLRWWTSPWRRLVSRRLTLLPRVCKRGWGRRCLSNRTYKHILSTRLIKEWQEGASWLNRLSAAAVCTRPESWGAPIARC